ncbi:MAG: single-stranded DNA-binding protein, partial [Rhodoglobus sp.]
AARSGRNRIIPHHPAESSLTMAEIQITGTLGRDCEMRSTAGGDAVANFSIADDLRRKSASGEWETISTTWWRVALWGKAGEQAAEWLTKGARVLVIGTVHERKYESGGEMKSSFDVKARQVAEFPRSQSAQYREQNTGGQQQAQAPRSSNEDPWATGAGRNDEPPF